MSILSHYHTHRLSTVRKKKRKNCFLQAEMIVILQLWFLLKHFTGCSYPERNLITFGNICVARFIACEDQRKIRKKPTYVKSKLLLHIRKTNMMITQ